MSKVYFIGKIPPPLGGVTVFNQRKFEQLKRESSDVQLILIQPTKSNILNIALAFFSSNEKHLSASNFLLIIFAILFAKSNTIIFYDHNSSRHLSAMRKWKKVLYAYFLFKCAKIVLVDKHLKDNYKNLDNFEVLSNKFAVSSAFLPPSELELNDILKTYDQKTISVYQHCLNISERKVILTSAFQPNLDINGNDIYTIELLIDFFVNLSQKYSQYYFIIAIANYSETQFSIKIKEKVSTVKVLYPNLIFLENDKKIWPLLQVTKLFIRATTTDGDSVSLKEALYFGAPVLASDVVPRPKGVMLFNLEKDDLSQKIDEYLGSY